jgi:hypothetical protein
MYPGYLPGQRLIGMVYSQMVNPVEPLQQVVMFVQGYLVHLQCLRCCRDGPGAFRRLSLGAAVESGEAEAI